MLGTFENGYQGKKKQQRRSVKDPALKFKSLLIFSVRCFRNIVHFPMAFPARGRKSLRLFCLFKSFFGKQSGASFLWQQLWVCTHTLSFGISGLCQGSSVPQVLLQWLQFPKFFAGGVCSAQQELGAPLLQRSSTNSFFKQRLYGWERGLETSLSPCFVVS